MKGCLTFCMISFSFMMMSSLFLDTMKCLSMTFSACSCWVVLCRA